MERAGTGVRELARIVHRDPGYISKILSGQRPCGPALARSIDDALRAGGEIVAAVAAQPRPPSNEQRPMTPEQAHGTPRRDFVLLAATVASLLDVLRAAPAAARSSSVDDATAAGLDSVMAGYRQVYQSAGAQALLDPVCGALHLLAGIAPSAGRHRDRVVSLIGQAASLAAAMLLLDAGDRASALRYAAVASRAAAQSGDRELAAITLAIRAFGAAYYSGDPAEGVAFACAASDAAAGAHPRTRGWALAVESEMHATVGDERQAMRALDDSAAALGGEMPETSWKGIGAFTPAKLTAYRGGALMRLRRYGPAQSALLEALGQLDPVQVKHRCTAHTDLADAYALDGRPDQAVSQAGLALDIIEQTRHAESLRRVAAVHAAVRPAGIPAARDLGGRIAEARDLMASER
jgi:tetratricopeptide (TPR) repeat protein